jgi:signal transduction histidine kinase
MPSPPTSPGWLRERTFLVFGLGAALVLVLAALAGNGDPESAGRAELVSTAARIAEAVKVEWKEWPGRWDAGDQVDWARRLALVSPLMEWKEGELPFIQGRELVRDTGPGHEVFDALLAKSEQIELAQNDPAGALDLVLDALGKDTDPARRADGRLRAVQLAVKTKEPARAHAFEQYELACKELDGSERKGNISYRLLLDLAIAPCIEAENKDARTISPFDKYAWVMPALRLAPPSSPDGHWSCEEDPSTQALLDLVKERVRLPFSFAGHPLGTQDHDPYVDIPPVRTADAMRAEFGSVPTTDTTTVSLRRARVGFLAYWMLHGNQQGGFVSDQGIRTAFTSALKSSTIAPESFVVDVDPPASKAKAVREHDSLDGDYGFTVKHEDPEGWIRRSAVKQKVLRVALLVLALLSAAAGVATFRAQRRERTLATLKTDFIANVSHELRTPLSSILLLSENLETGRVKSEDERTRYHTLIRREALRLRRLVDDVLDFSRLERGKRVEVHREPLRVDPWLERTCEDLADWAREHALELAIARSPTEADAELDAEALRRALLNLLDNARKHSGTQQIELTAAREGHELVLSVRDHGRGIPAADREHVFEPFTRLDGHAAPGAGLGLSIVREIAREHGGNVRCLEPASGPGIVFQMRIPLAEESKA